MVFDINSNSPKGRVLMAMSGGVDSSVSALLLLQQGYEVVGATMHLFDNSSSLNTATSSKTCCSLEDVEDARAVCNRLGIEHYVFNYTDEFAESVMDRFCKSYLCGLTPNPCIDCNRYLKFNALQKRRKELGFDYVATGHYARRIYNDQSLKYMLYRGKDVSKDQGYVLYHLDQDTLAHMLFPLGDLKKTEVRAIAEKAGFINAHKHESQDICFVPDGDYSSFIEQYYGAKSNEGSIVDTAGNILGSHNGIINYTVGQRRGLGIAAKEPLYVIKKDALTNSITVGFKDELFISRVIARDINLIDEDPWFEPRALQIKPNYRAGFSSAKVYCKTLSYEGCEEMCIIAELDKPIQACSPGQALVIYDGDHVVGGGTICEDIQ